jgi:hypothetical protein
MAHVRFELVLVDEFEVCVGSFSGPRRGIVRQLLRDRVKEACPAGCGADLGDVV